MCVGGRGGDLGSEQWVVPEQAEMQNGERRDLRQVLLLNV